MGCVLRMIVVGTGQLPNSTGVVFGVGFPTHSRCSFENTPMHHRGVLFGREAFGRVGVDFAWNVHVVKIGTAGQELARVAILPRSIGRGTAGEYGWARRHPRLPGHGLPCGFAGLRFSERCVGIQALPDRCRQCDYAASRPAIKTIVIRPVCRRRTLDVHIPPGEVPGRDPCVDGWGLRCEQ